MRHVWAGDFRISGRLSYLHVSFLRKSHSASRHCSSSRAGSPLSVRYRS